MTEFKPLQVGEPGRRYVLSLTEHIPGLCSTLAPIVASEGVCYAIVAEGMTLDQAREFEASPGSTNCSADVWLARRLVSLSEAGRRGVLMIQDLWFKPADHAKTPPQTDFWFSGDEVYFWQEFGPNHTPDLDLLFREPHSFNVVAFLVEDPSVADELRTGNADVRMIVRRVKEVYASAYDQESFVMWVR